MSSILFALYHELKIAWKKGIRCLVRESNSELYPCFSFNIMIVLFINSHAPIINSMQWELHFQHCHMEAICMCVYWLSKMGSSSQDGITLLDSLPAPIVPLVLAEVRGVAHNFI